MKKFVLSVFLLISSEMRPLSPDEGGSLAEHADAEALPLSLVDPHLLGGVQTCQHRSPFPSYQARVHVLQHTHMNVNVFYWEYVEHA